MIIQQDDTKLLKFKYGNCLKLINNAVSEKLVSKM